MANPNLLPGLVPYDLTRGGVPFNFHATHNINQYAFYVQDTITLGHLTINVGLRDDQYNGLVSATDRSRGWVSPICLEDRHGSARRLFAHLRDAFQREPAAFERDRHRRAGGTMFRDRVHPHPARRSQPVQCRPAAGDRQMADGRRRLFLEVHAQRVRLRRAVQHDHHVPDRLAQFESSTASPAASAPSTCMASRHTGPSATRARVISRPKIGGLIRQGAARRRRVPHRSRSGLSADHQSALPAPQERASGSISPGASTAAWWSAACPTSRPRWR